MNLINPFRCLLAKPEFVASIVAPPYDVLTRGQAYQLGQDNPNNFVHLSRPEIDLAADIADYDPEIYTRGKQNLAEFKQRKIYHQQDAKNYYLYQIKTAEHCQTGIVCQVAANSEHLRWHEHTRPTKVNDRLALTNSLQAQISPVLLSAEFSTECLELLTQITNQHSPILNITRDNGEQHQIWQVSDPEQIKQISAAFNPAGILYIADGHHRCACARQLDPPQILSVVFPHQQLNILGYHRVVQAPDLTITDVLTQLASNFIVNPIDQPFIPQHKGEYGMYHNHQWYRLQFKDRLSNYAVLEQLDTNIMQNFIIEKLFGINDPRQDPRLDFIGGTDAIELLTDSVDNQAMDYAFTLPATAIQEILYVADHDQVMPPKSTWFEPKLLDGFFIV